MQKKKILGRVKLSFPTSRRTSFSLPTIEEVRRASISCLTQSDSGGHLLWKIEGHSYEVGRVELTRLSKT